MRSATYAATAPRKTAVTANMTTIRTVPPGAASATTKYAARLPPDPRLDGRWLHVTGISGPRTLERRRGGLEPHRALLGRTLGSLNGSCLLPPELTAMDPVWTPKTKGGAGLVMGVYIAIWLAYVYLVRDQKYPAPMDGARPHRRVRPLPTLATSSVPANRATQPRRIREPHRALLPQAAWGARTAPPYP